MRKCGSMEDEIKVHVTRLWIKGRCITVKAGGLRDSGSGEGVLKACGIWECGSRESGS